MPDRSTPPRSQGLDLPRVVLGTMWPDPESLTAREVARRLDTALDSGLSAFDTAPIYGLGRIEEFLGEALAGRRDELMLLGKVGLRWDDDTGEVLFRQAQPDGTTICVRKNSRPDSIRHEVEVSLKRLRTDHLDLVQIHQRDRLTPLSESLGALADLADEGKVRWIGVSNFDADDTAEAVRILGPSGLASNQLPYSLIDRQVERRIAPALQTLNVPLLAYSPTGGGLLGGARLVDLAKTSRRAAAIEGVLAGVLRPMAEAHEVTVPQLAVAWVLHRPGVMSAIVGTRDDGQIHEAAAASGIVLDDTTQKRLMDAFRGISPNLDLGYVTRARRLACRAGGAMLRRLRTATASRKGSQGRP